MSPAVLQGRERDERHRRRSSSNKEEEEESSRASSLFFFLFLEASSVVVVGGLLSPSESDETRACALWPVSLSLSLRRYVYRCPPPFCVCVAPRSWRSVMWCMYVCVLFWWIVFFPAVGKDLTKEFEDSLPSAEGEDGERSRGLLPAYSARGEGRGVEEGRRRRTRGRRIPRGHSESRGGLRIVEMLHTCNILALAGSESSSLLRPQGAPEDKVGWRDRHPTLSLCCPGVRTPHIIRTLCNV